MKKKITKLSISETLRTRAEQKLIHNQLNTDFHHSLINEHKLFHELQVHQIEIEMQNEQLLQAQSDLDESQKKITEIFKFAPNSYFTINNEGRIQEVNFTGASLLGMNRDALVNQPFEKFIFHSDKSIFIQSQLNLITTRSHQVCEIRISRIDGQRLYVRLDLSIIEHKENFQFLIIATDITIQKHIEDTQAFLLGNSWAGSGRDFFEELAEYLSKALQVDYVCIDRLKTGSLEAQTVAIYFDGHFENNICYSLQDTPCGKVVEQSVCSFPREVRLVFPEDKILQEIQAESYVGITLRGSDGNPVGLIAVISRRPLKDTRASEIVLKQVSIRAVSEFEHRQVEAALREREFFFKESQHAAFIGSYKINFLTGLWESSEVLDQIFGIEPGYKRNVQGWLDIVHPDEQEMMNRYLMEDIIAKGTSFNKEYRIIRKKDGANRWVHGLGKVESDSGGTIISMLGTIQDITNRKVAEELLKESEQRYHSLFEESNDAIILVDLASGKYLDCNRSAEILTGYTRKEIIPQKIGALLAPSHKDEFTFNIEAILANNLLRRETEILTKEGKIVPVEFNSSLITINKKQCILSQLHDISDRKAAEKALKLSEARVRIKLQSILSPEGSIADLELEDILDIDSVQKLIESFNSLVNIPMAIVDMRGRVLVKVGWQDVCSKFHRIHPETCWNCIESDVYLSHGTPEGEFKLYKCKNNMWDIATPLVIGGEHKGNLFLGQFFIEDEPIDYTYFSEQALRVGYPTEEYMDAIEKVPRLSKLKLDQAKEFFLNLAHSITQLSYSNVKLAKAITQQKQVEDSLRQSEQSLKKAQEIAHLGSWSFNPVTKHLDWSDEMYSIFGVKLYEFVPSFEEFLEAVHPEDREAVKTAYDRSIKEGEDSYGIEYRICRKDSGEVRHMNEKCKHISDASGNLIGSVGMTHDITERKQAADKILENERFLHESQAIAHIGSYATDLISQTWKASPEIYEIFGIDRNYPNTLVGWVERVHPQFREELVNDLFQDTGTGKLFDHEYKILRLSDGAERWIHGLGEFEYNDAQTPVRLIGTIQDITERKAKEKALSKLNRTLGALSKSSQAMSHSVNEEDYLQKVCKIVVDDTDFAMVWIGYAEDDANKTVRPVASAGLTNDYIESIKVTWDDSETGNGPTGTAIRTGKMSMCNNMLTDPGFKPWREQATKKGFASSIVFPLKTGEKTFGAISIYSNEPDSFFEDEISMLGELANDLAHGITSIRLKATHQLAEEALSRSHNQLEVLIKERTRELSVTNELLNKEIIIRKQKEQHLKAAEEKYRTVADYTHGWEYWISPDGSIQYMSPAVEKITGYVEEDFKLNPHLRDLIVYPEDQHLWRNHKREPIKTAHSDAHEDMEFRIITKSGEIRWIGHSCRKIYSDDKYLGIRVSNRDITEKVKAENELLNVTVKVEENERNRISRELHDGLGPLLSTIKLYFQWLAETDNPSKIKIITEKGNQSIDRAIQTTREVSHGLNSQILSTYGYVGAMLQFIQSINETQKLTINFYHNSDERFSELLEITLYRITTELINNTINYAEATHVEIEFNYYRDKKNITFTYADDGIGFDMEGIEKADKGIGLLNIKQRLKIVRGRLSFKSSIGKGVVVRIELPVSETPD